MNRKLLLVFASAALVGAGVAARVGGSDAYAGGGRAHFEFTPGEMDVAITGHGRDAASYYLPYTLKNPMDEAMTPRLYIEVRTETNRTSADRSDQKVVAAAEKSLKTKGLKTTNELRAQELAAGAAAQGVADFGNIDPYAHDLQVRVYGLFDPVVRTRNGKVYSEKRVLVLQFGRQGDEYDRPLDPISLKWKKEEVEGEPVELYSTGGDKKK